MGEREMSDPERRVYEASLRERARIEAILARERGWFCLEDGSMLRVAERPNGVEPHTGRPAFIWVARCASGHQFDLERVETHYERADWAGRAA